jgi:hypothetical protein
MRVRVLACALGGVLLMACSAVHTVSLGSVEAPEEHSATPQADAGPFDAGESDHEDKRDERDQAEGQAGAESP